MPLTLDWRDWTWDGIWNVAETPVRLLVLVLIGFLVRFLVHRAIDQVAAKAAGFTPGKRRPKRLSAVMSNGASLYSQRRSQRAHALASLFKSITTAALATIVVLMILGALGFQLAPLLASAGIAGAAIAFGAQNLVKDFLSGVFMLVEDQFGVGDVIDLGEAVGTVESVSLRITRVRDADGVLWHVRNGEVLRVGNKSQGWSTLLLDISIAYDQDVDHAEAVIKDTARTLAEEDDWKDKVIDVPEPIGVQDVNGAAVTIRILGKCVANEQFAMQRELRERLKLAFDAEGIRVPPPTWPGQPGALDQGTPTGAP